MQKDHDQPLFLTIDQGGHASRAFVIDSRGRVVSHGMAKIQTFCSGQDRVEHDPLELLESVRHAVQRAVRPLDDPGRIAAAGLATQRSTVVCWDSETGAPLSTAISWQDRRNTSCIESLREYAARVRSETGLFLSAHYGASKLRWCLDNLPAVRGALAAGRLAWGPLASYLLHELLEERPLLADPANASRTLLFALSSCDWSPALLDLFALPREGLPRCVPTQYRFGHLEVAGFQVPLVVCTGDQSSVPFVTGRPDTGVAYVNIGTGAFIQRVVGPTRLDTERLLSGILWMDSTDRLYVIEGTVNGASSATRSMARKLGSDARSGVSTLTDPAETAPLFLNGVSGVGSPFWQPHLDSRFLGDGSPEQLMRAVYESVVFLIHTNLEEIVKAAGSLSGIVLTGGLAANDEICQVIAALTGLRVVRPELTEATIRGLGFLLAGQPRGWPAASGQSIFRPRPNRILEERYQRWRAAMNEATSMNSRPVSGP